VNGSEIGERDVVRCVEIKIVYLFRRDNFVQFWGIYFGWLSLFWNDPMLNPGVHRRPQKMVYFWKNLGRFHKFGMYVVASFINQLPCLSNSLAFL